MCVLYFADKHKPIAISVVPSFNATQMLFVCVFVFHSALSTTVSMAHHIIWFFFPYFAFFFLQQMRRLKIQKWLSSMKFSCNCCVKRSNRPDASVHIIEGLGLGRYIHRWFFLLSFSLMCESGMTIDRFSNGERRVDVRQHNGIVLMLCNVRRNDTNDTVYSYNGALFSVISELNGFDLDLLTENDSWMRLKYLCSEELALKY